MKIHLIDGTYELYRGFYGPPSRKAPDGREVGATISFARSLLSLLTKGGATHMGCAFDSDILSFRNQLFAGYKTGEGIDPDLHAQFPLAEEVIAALGIVVWPMIEFEADDAIATAATRFQHEANVEQVVICSPDKDFAQLVLDDQVICWDRRREIIYNDAAVKEKYGVSPASIPDWLALVGDAADGIPGIKAWGAKSSATVLSKFTHIEDIPEDTSDWGITPGRSRRLVENLFNNMDDALLYKKLATLRKDVPLKESVADLEWKGISEEFMRICEKLGVPKLLDSYPNVRRVGQ